MNDSTRDFVELLRWYDWYPRNPQRWEQYEPDDNGIEAVLYRAAQLANHDVVPILDWVTETKYNARHPKWLVLTVCDMGEIIVHKFCERVNIVAAIRVVLEEEARAKQE
jgi:hypothetical protein